MCGERYGRFAFITKSAKYAVLERANEFRRNRIVVHGRCMDCSFICMDFGLYAEVGLLDGIGRTSGDGCRIMDEAKPL